MSKTNTLIERLFLFANSHPTRDALATPRYTFSYQLLACAVVEQVKKLQEMGITKNAIIGIQCSNDTEHLLLCLASSYLGATSFTVPSHEPEHTQQSLIDRCGATHVVNTNSSIDPVQFLADANPSLETTEPTTPASNAQLLFSTSGTTGDPKLVVHYDTDIVAQAHRHISSQDERFACLASMEHNFSKRHRLYCLAAGATNIFVDDDRENLVTQCQVLNVNVLHVSAFQAQELLVLPEINALKNIRLKLGGSHVPMPMRQALRTNITSDLQAGYGTTETGAIAFTEPTDSHAGESVGKPLPGIELCVVDNHQKPLGNGERGELAIRCTGMFRGYYGNPELTSVRLKEGWFYTGDIGYLDDQQRIYLIGRSDDMFVFNSMNIYPQDIESEIRQYPDVVDAVVLPKESPVHGNIPVALVVLNKNVKHNLPALKKFVQKRVGIRSPRQYTIVDEIPANTSGKISRTEAIKLTAKSGQVRQDIVDLLDARLTKRLKPSQVAAFIKGDEDISFRDIGMDSLARMDMMIGLETGFDVIITPREFGEYRSLGKIVSRVLSPPQVHQGEQEEEEQLNRDSTTPNTDHVITDAHTLPSIVRLFRRAFSFCHTVAQLNKTLSTLELRLTPNEFECLKSYHLKGHLIPENAAKKFHTAVSAWLKETKKLMLGSGKQEPESYRYQRLTPTISYFFGPGSASEKTLLICFPPRDTRQLMMPNTVLMQHINSSQFDLLIISEPLQNGYQLGSVPFGKKMNKQIQWLSEQPVVAQYRHVRTLGFSAGCYPAIVAAYRLNAEMVMSISGRFHSKKYPLINLDKFITTRKAIRSGQCSKVIVSYSADNAKDKKYANFIAKITGGSHVAVEFSDGKVGHSILSRLVERNELATYLAHTLFADTNPALNSHTPANLMLTFPSREVQAL